MHRYPTHRSVVAFDVEGFSDPYRDDDAQTAVRAGMYKVMRESFASAGIPWDACVHEDRTDGAIVVVPPEISKVLLISPLLGTLSAALVGHNSQARLAERIRLRLAVHAGEVSMDDHGLSGTDLVVACRLLVAEQLRTSLRHSPVPLAAIVSDGIYDGIVRHCYGDIDPANYHPVPVSVKRTRLQAWIHLPGTETPPVIERAPAAGMLDSPRQLQPGVATFVNRKQELRALDRARRSGRLVVLVGPPGVGKTAFALHWAHRVRDRYEGGQFYADLGGPGRPVELAEVFGKFLRALGIAPPQVPLDLDEQAAMFRSLTAGRRLLVLLDNVASADQVRALLPSSPMSVTVATSRSQLEALIAEGAQFVQVDRLAVEDGVELLARTVSGQRIKAEPGAARELVRMCDGLPVALCVVAARLVSRPKWTVQKVVADLVDEQRRLTRLSYGDDLSVKAVFDVSYQALSLPAARLYRLLGMHPGPDFDSGVAAAVLATSHSDAEHLVDELLTANLLEEVAEDCYRFHDLIRLHALSLAERDESAADQALGLRRMLDWYLAAATEAGHVVTPHRQGLRRDIEQIPREPVTFGGHADAIDWLDRQRRNLLAAARKAFEQGLRTVTWQLADAMWGLFLFRKHYHDWMQFDLLAVEATRGGPDVAAEAEAQDRLGLLFQALGRNDEALQHMQRAAELWRQLDERHRMTSSIERFGFVYLDQGRIELAIEHFQQALAGYRERGEQRSAGLALISIGRAMTEAGRYDEAIGSLHEARAELGSLQPSDPYNFARALLALGRAETGAGNWETARENLTETLAVMREVKSPLGEADAHWALGELYDKSGQRSLAREYYQRTETMLTELGNPGVEKVRAQLDALG
ncbi:tetratricopeptide (TPR) repeat protein [Kibdelosporangium banguiense]|uniref:Tetratricopeptide (TPR) repeat protein n=1 Tax=Kibdelosporangium banguiense TaxID=1365924 RepID=A0ABS4TF14_9PSEU|nr:tetratricopeptide repeat protein [Kibdelosporangium banguiense]MBP2323007.1 tetratricopeptide (TPR) repeat protein [Kibdelosporangium banguiense]